MQSFTEIKELNILIYLSIDSKTFGYLSLLNKYNHDLFVKLSNDKIFLQKKLLLRLGLIGEENTNYQYILKTYDNDLTLAENCYRDASKDIRYNKIFSLLSFNKINFTEIFNEGHAIVTKKSLATNKYCELYWRCVSNNLINSVKSEEDDIIIITFTNHSLQIKLVADYECSDVSWFECKDINSIIGKEIRYIYDSNYHAKLPESGEDCCDTNHLIVVEFIDGSEYKFYLRNASNGYYSGYLTIYVIENGEEIKI